MYHPSGLTTASGQAKPQIVPSAPLPRWDQLPPTYQRELVRLLATLLLKCLSGPSLSQEEQSHE